MEALGGSVCASEWEGRPRHPFALRSTHTCSSFTQRRKRETASSPTHCSTSLTAAAPQLTVGGFAPTSPPRLRHKPRPRAVWGRPGPTTSESPVQPRGRERASDRTSSKMVSWMISRMVVLAFGTLYPAYASYKAVKTKNVKEYVKWMMYWIVFALFSTAETATDLFLSWFPFYFELKIAFVIWLLSPYTKGSSVLYRKFVHPTLSNKEKEIDDYIAQAKDRSYETMMRFGKRGLNLAANAAVTAATKGQGVLSDKLRSFSMQDLTLINADDELSLHSSDGRMRRDSVDDMSSGASTLPRAKSAATRQTRSMAHMSLADDISSQHSSDLSDAKTEHSDEDPGEKAPKRTTTAKTTKKPAVKTEAQCKMVKKAPKKKTISSAETPP
ncbi:receptor expression-enhancing protein 2 [Syngnathoides biaculeatus]|uniref:receptor expression-enhancing protein 2 n=1 Tax=Syngnathoides biaculeatus TaxID=300417 RepID=UPI002ADDAF3A|nr:receptor expression-enhancing protein 2 [Syngnathoides biaculeatus]